MNPDNLRSLADLPPERRREIARMGGKASGIERARRAYMKQSAREIILKMHYFYEAEEELETEWKEFQRWRRQKKKSTHLQPPLAIFLLTKAECLREYTTG